jgi:large subunit ribosomal protein L38
MNMISKWFVSEINYKDPSLHFKVDIGYPRAKPSRSQELRERIAILQAAKSNPETERLSRMKQRKQSSLV